VDDEGSDLWKRVKQTGSHHETDRLDRISTTDLIGRMLSYKRAEGEVDKTDCEPVSLLFPDAPLVKKKWKFDRHYRIYKKFASECLHPHQEDQPIVYIDGAWDMLHAGHARTLEAARRAATEHFGREPHLIVGVHHDGEISKRWPGYPIMNSHERVLSVMAMKYVDNVIMDAPWLVTEEFCKMHDIQTVYHATFNGAGDYAVSRYAYPRRAGMLRVMPREQSPSIEGIARKIKNDHTKRDKSLRHSVIRCQSCLQMQTRVT